MQTTFFREWMNSSYVKYKYTIIGRLISIKVLWKLSHPNILIKGKL